MTKNVKVVEKNGKNYIQLDNVQLCWPCLGSKRNEMSNKYQVDICQLQPAQIKAIKDLGFDVKTEDQEKLEKKAEETGYEQFDRGVYVTVKSKEQYYTIKHPNSVELTVEEVDRLGNGTKVWVLISPYAWDFKGKKGESLGLDRIIIRDFVEAPRNNDADADDIEAEVLAELADEEVSDNATDF